MAKVQNRERLLKKLAALPPKVRLRVGAALVEGAEEIASAQRRLAPKKTGALARSIKVVKGSYRPDNSNVRGVGGAGAGDPDLTVRVVAGDATAWYARLVEFGTAPHEAGGKFTGADHPGARPRPYFYPAYRSLKRRVKGRVSRATTKAVREIAS